MSGENIRITAQETSAESEDRFHRFRLIGWWDQERLSQAKILVVGAGALGNEIVKNLALLGIGNILVLDMDRIENSNLSRSVLYREEDNGLPKAQVAAREAQEIYPQANVHYLDGNVIHDVGMGVFGWADLVLGGLDNREARLTINRHCYRLGRPWIDGAIEQIQGMARMFVPRRSLLRMHDVRNRLEAPPDAAIVQSPLPRRDGRRKDAHHADNQRRHRRGAMPGDGEVPAWHVDARRQRLGLPGATRTTLGQSNTSGRKSATATIRWTKSSGSTPASPIVPARISSVSSGMNWARTPGSNSPGTWSRNWSVPSAVRNSRSSHRSPRSSRRTFSAPNATTRGARWSHSTGSTGKSRSSTSRWRNWGVPAFDILIARDGDRAIGLELSADAAEVLGPLVGGAEELELE